MCIVPASSPCRYQALSYVWGRTPMLQLLASNLDALSKPGSLDIKSLPYTIQDAIIVTRKIGESHLWVDSLCIIQDDYENQREQIVRMG
jgi:Heterokaryon incompatibility protein (HET)